MQEPVLNTVPIMTPGFCKSQHAMIKRIIPPKCCQVHSAMSEILLVTHGQTIESTPGPIGVAVKMLG